jgi:hypothetical protein
LPASGAGIDPYERRPDPRDPASVDTPALPGDEEKERQHTAPAPPSTSEPHPPRNYYELKPEKGDRSP